MNSDSVNSRGSTPAAVMAARRLVLLLMMMTVTGVVAAEASTTVTDRELAEVVVEKTSKFLEGPTGRALTIQDRFQGWINSLELQISELAYNAVNRAASAFSRIPFFETYFSQYQENTQSLLPYSQPSNVQAPEQWRETLKHYIQAQKNQHVREHFLQAQELNSQTQEPNLQALELQAQVKDLQSQDHTLISQDHNLLAQKHSPQAQEFHLQTQEQYLQSQERHLGAQLKLVRLQEFPPPKLKSPAVQELVSSGKPSPYVPFPLSVSRPPQVLAFANGQVNEGSVDEAINRVFIEDGGDSSGVRGQVGAIEQPHVAGGGSYRHGPYYPDPVKGVFALEPAARYPSPKSALQSEAKNNSSPTRYHQKFYPDQYEPPPPVYDPLHPFSEFNPLSPFYKGTKKIANQPLPPLQVNNPMPPLPEKNYLPSLPENNSLSPLPTNDLLPTLLTNNPLPPFLANNPLPSLPANNNLPPLPTNNPLPPLPANNLYPPLPANNPLKSLSANSPLPYLSANSPLPYFSEKSPLSPLSANSPVSHFAANNPLPFLSSNSPLPPFSANNPFLPLSGNSPSSPLPAYWPTPRHAYRTEVTSNEVLSNAEK